MVDDIIDMPLLPVLLETEVVKGKQDTCPHRIKKKKSLDPDEPN